MLFFEGKKPKLMKSLEKDMKALAKKYQFEQNPSVPAEYQPFKRWKN
jgi:excinuclease UvrABC nuclease subunit